MGRHLHLLATAITAKTNQQRPNSVSSGSTANLHTILSAAPGVDVPTLSQDHHMVISTWNLTDQPLLKKLQKHRLQNLHAELALHSNAAIIVWPKHVHLVLICKSSSGRRFTMCGCTNRWGLILPQIPGSFPHPPVTQAVKSAPHATCRMAFPCSFSTFLGCRYEAWSPCPSWPTILAPPWTFWWEGWQGSL